MLGGGGGGERRGHIIDPHVPLEWGRFLFGNFGKEGGGGGGGAVFIKLHMYMHTIEEDVTTLFWLFTDLCTNVVTQLPKRTTEAGAGP